MPATEVVAGADISWTPPCRADCCCLQLAAQRGGGEFLDLHLAAAFFRQQLGEALNAEADRVVGVVQVAELDDAHRRVGGQGRRAGYVGGTGAGQGECEQFLHGVSPLG
jgi:hypothetical protein